MIGGSDAALVRKYLPDVSKHEPYCQCQLCAVHTTFDLLAAAAERAGEYRSNVAGWQNRTIKAEAALLVAQQERDDWERRFAASNARVTRAEATVTRLREALRLASHAFAQYAEERNDPPDEAVAGYMDGFMQDAELRRVAQNAETKAAAAVSGEDTPPNRERET